MQCDSVSHSIYSISMLSVPGGMSVWTVGPETSERFNTACGDCPPLNCG